MSRAPRGSVIVRRTATTERGSAMIYDSILHTIGRTPIVRVHRSAPAHVAMYVKCEFFNPLSSVKDRLAIAIIEDAERSGALKPGQTVVEATSGNTGIALAMVCAAKGYPFVAIMVETFSIERRKIMRMLGAKVILTPAAERGSGMVRKAEELAKKHGWFLARQFENPANPGLSPPDHGPGDPERLRRPPARLLRHRLGHGRHADRRGRNDPSCASRGADRRDRAGGRVAARRCGIQAAQDPGLDAGLRAEGAQSLGAAPDRPGDRRRVDRRGALRWRATTASSAASPRAARSPRRSRWPRRRRQGSVILAMLPDTGERYMSTPLFEGIAEGSDPEP